MFLIFLVKCLIFIPIWWFLYTIPLLCCYRWNVRTLLERESEIRRLLPCLCTKAKPDKTWNKMFLISLSENIVSSLAAAREVKDKKTEKRGGKDKNTTQTIKWGNHQLTVALKTVLKEERKRVNLWYHSHLLSSRERSESFFNTSVLNDVFGLLNYEPFIPGQCGQLDHTDKQGSTQCILKGFAASHLPCLWIKDSPCNIWNVMFLTSDSGNNLFLKKSRPTHDDSSWPKSFSHSQWWQQNPLHNDMTKRTQLVNVWNKAVAVRGILLTFLSWADRGFLSYTQRQSRGGRFLWSLPSVSPHWHGSASSVTENTSVTLFKIVNN